MDTVKERASCAWIPEDVPVRENRALILGTLFQHVVPAKVTLYQLMKTERFPVARLGPSLLAYFGSGERASMFDLSDLRAPVLGVLLRGDFALSEGDKGVRALSRAGDLALVGVRSPRDARGGVSVSPSCARARPSCRWPELRARSPRAPPSPRAP